MRDLEEQIARVRNSEVRPLVQEAYRCYTSRAARAAIVLTWTAVCADLIDKVRVLHEQGEPEAKDMVKEIDAAQGRLDTESVRTMQRVENTLLERAVTMELIDATHKLQLDRLREDRNLCAHPSLRPLGELFDPPLEHARAHLATALDAVLVHPASQGRKVVDSFAAHVLDDGFLGDPNHIAHVFLHRVRPSAQRRVVEFAARHALLELPVDGINAQELADRMGICLRVFAAEDRGLARDAVAKSCSRLLQTTVPIQRRALARLGDLDVFWAGIDAPMTSQLDAIVDDIGVEHSDDDLRNTKLKPSETLALSLVAVAEVRTSLASLERAFIGLPTHKRARVISQRPGPYFGRHLAPLMAEAASFDQGQLLARIALLPNAGDLNLSQLQAVLDAWLDNSQCWGRAMPGYAVDLYHGTGHLGGARNPLWRAFLDQITDDDWAHSTITSGIGELLEDGQTL
ncbi:hypothetical protein OG754_40250 (plasmid) [Streptomyces decoyicus]|uniref:hypothetical protein n=1 Tax=Streptomyces decoyicus TaxID=249567 RepID=UPI002E32C08F|nr:hypothetical protein [Streptomyces decoyicus]